MNVDFETYSECDIKAGTFRYAKDISTEILCMAYGESKNDVKIWYPGQPFPSDLVEHILYNGKIRAWNATFEYAIFNYVGTKLDWPKLRPDQMLCTQADAMALSLPAGLGPCAHALGTEDQKDSRGKLLIQRLCKPRKVTKNKQYTRVTPEIDPEMFQELYEYCIKDVQTEMAIFEKLPKNIKGQELELFHQSIEINERGVPVDAQLVNSILEAKSEYETRLNKEIEDITDGKLLSTGSRPQSLKWLKENGLELDGYTKADIKAGLKKDYITPEVRRFLEVRSELSRTPIKKFDFIKMAICPDGTLKNNLIYHKATTGRYAGCGFQLHNLPRDSHKEPEKLINNFLTGNTSELNVYNEGIKLTRSVITAPKGKKLVVSDFSSIENRFTLWVARDMKNLQKFEDPNFDQYKDTAVDIYNIDFEKVNKDQRQLGKIAVLSCGFGGGWKTFQKVCKDSWGIEISDEQAQFIVEGYRTKYAKVVRFWYGLYEEALKAVATPGVVTQYNMIKFRCADNFLYLRLPNGRKLAYYKPELRMIETPWKTKKLALTHMGQNTYTRKWERLTVIPGRLTENVVQATARDALVEAMLRVERHGYPVIACVHDEIISLVDKDFGSIDEFNKLMEVRPVWALDCPIHAEGYEEKRYRK